MLAWQLKERLMWAMVTLMVAFAVASVVSLLFFVSWFLVLAMLVGFFTSLLMAHFTHEMAASDRQPSLDQAMARFRRPDAPVRD